EYAALKGCAADADAVEAYLESKLSVDKSQITSLRNERATRSAIIQAFRALENDGRIQHGSPILIYFAGHGGEATAPEGWPCSGKVQMIIPLIVDRLSMESRISQSNRISNVSQTKGENITVIFDNCFSGSGTRSLSGGAAPLNGTVRAVNYRAALPKTLLDSDRIILVARRGIRVASDYVASGQRSHILLAACRSNEYAREANNRGVFTQALLQVLPGLDISTITYKELLKRIPHLSTDQNPQCEGHGQNRIIFDARIVTRPTDTPYEGKILSNGILELQAGAAQDSVETMFSRSGETKATTMLIEILPWGR
ncbi:caspase domain-containing protein, partial [Pholiota molesta]